MIIEETKPYEHYAMQYILWHINIMNWMHLIDHCLLTFSCPVGWITTRIVQKCFKNT